jgi:SagB-type dehydrogenase family enzyme
MPFPWNKIEGSAAEDELWMLFHENTKSSRYDPPPPSDAAIARVLNFWTALPYEGYEQIPLPEQLTLLDRPVSNTIGTSGQYLRPFLVPVAHLSTMLHSAFGITRRHGDGTASTPPVRMPEAGGVHPLELYIHAAHVEGLAAGLYHFDLRERRLDLVQPGDCSRQIAAALRQPELALNAAAIVFITAVFERAIVKYSGRGYRFVLLEAGHAAQNLNIAAAALDLGSVNIDSFMDHEIDSLLGIDGIAHSTLYLVGIGKNAPEPGWEQINK